MRSAVRAHATLVGLLAGALALLPATAGAEDRAALLARGQTAFTLNGCHGCHVIGKLGTPIGPELSRVGARYSPEYLARWLRDPALQRPSAHMPALELTEADIHALAAYLGSLR